MFISTFLLALSKGIVILFALHAIWILILSLLVTRWLNILPARATAESSSHPTIVVLLPALREQRLVAETLCFYAGVEYPGRLLPVVITSEKENAERQQQLGALPALFARLAPGHSDEELNRLLAEMLSPSDRATVAAQVLQIPADAVDLRCQVAQAALRDIPTTAELCDLAIEGLAGSGHRCYRLHYPETTGRKGSQLNYAITQLNEWDADAPFERDTTLVAVYDFDAVPHPQTFVTVAAEAARRRAAGQPIPRMLQQVQVPFRFRAPFAAGTDGLLMRGQVLYWLRRGLAIEVGRLLLKRGLERGRLPRLVRGVARPMIYGIGSGMILRLDALDVIGPFPEPHDDLAIGYRASFLGWEIAPLPSFNLTEPYYTTSALIRAWASVAYGGTRVVADLRQVADRATVLRRWEQWFLVVKEWLDTLVWFGGIVVVPLAAVLTATSGLGWLLFVVGALLLAYPLTALVILSLLPRLRPHLGDAASHASWLPGRLTPAALIATFALQPFVSAAGPWSLAKRAVMTRRRGSELITGKTER